MALRTDAPGSPRITTQEPTKGTHGEFRRLASNDELCPRDLDGDRRAPELVPPMLRRPAQDWPIRRCRDRDTLERGRRRDH